MACVVSLQMDPTVPSNGPGLDSQKETRAAEDMFVDCPDEIESSESQQGSEEKDNLQNDQTNELDSEIKVQQVVAEIELLRDKLDKSVSEKKEYEVHFWMHLSFFNLGIRYIHAPQLLPHVSTPLMYFGANKPFNFSKLNKYDLNVFYWCK